MRVLVTGSRGFVGSWLVRHFESSGDAVTGLDENADVTDAALIREAVVGDSPDCIVHLAALSSVGSSWGDSSRTYEVNTVGTANLLDAAAACANPPRVLVVSSSEVYGWAGREALPAREELPVRPLSPYAASKAAAEIVAFQMFRSRKLEVIVARPFNHTGPGQTPAFVVPALAEQVAKAIASGTSTIKTGNLDVYRDISDVRDVVVAYRLLLENGRPGQIYNVCSGRSVSIRSVAERLIDLAGLDISIDVDQQRVRPVDVPDLWGDPGRLAADCGWEPAYSLERTLGDVLDYWKGNWKGDT
jgi:GDP-4-dehydro-6-deoxy-D-mannose reductase